MAINLAYVVGGMILYAVMVGVFILSVSEYEKNFNLMLEYVNGDEQAGDEIIGRTAFDVAFRLAFKGASHIISSQTQRVATKLLSKYVDESTVARIAGNSDGLYDTITYIRKLEKSGVSSDIISHALEALETGELKKLAKIAAGGFGDDILEKLLKNRGVLSAVDEGSLVRVLKGTAQNTDEVLKLFSLYGEHVNEYFMLYGDDALGFIIAHGDDGYRMISAYGHDAMIVLNELKDNAFDFIRNYSDDGVRFIVSYGDEGYKLFLTHGDDVIRIATEYGADGYKLIKEHGKNAIDIINESGEAGVQALIKHGSKYIEYGNNYSNFITAYAKYGDEAFAAFDKYGDAALGYLEGGSKTISQADRIKIDGWDFTPSDELYLKYKDVFDNPMYYDQVTGKIHWPVDDGFKAGSKIDKVIEKDTIFKRYGDESGEFLGNATDPFEKRSLAPHSENAEVHYYLLKKDCKMTMGEVAPWFGSDGGAEQFVKYKTDGSKYTIGELKNLGILEDITDLVEKGEIVIDQ